MTYKCSKLPRHFHLLLEVNLSMPAWLWSRSQGQMSSRCPPVLKVTKLTFIAHGCAPTCYIMVDAQAADERGILYWRAYRTTDDRRQVPMTVPQWPINQPLIARTPGGSAIPLGYEVICFPYCLAHLQQIYDLMYYYEYWTYGGDIGFVLGDWGFRKRREGLYIQHIAIGLGADLLQEGRIYLPGCNKAAIQLATVRPLIHGVYWWAVIGTELFKSKLVIKDM